MKDLFKAIKQKNLPKIQELILEESPPFPYQWDKNLGKNTYHQLCEYFDRAIFDAVFSKGQSLSLIHI